MRLQGAPPGDWNWLELVSAGRRWAPLNPHLVAGEHGLFGDHESEDIRTIFNFYSLIERDWVTKQISVINNPIFTHVLWNPTYLNVFSKISGHNTVVLFIKWKALMGWYTYSVAFSLIYSFKFISGNDFSSNSKSFLTSLVLKIIPVLTFHFHSSNWSYRTKFIELRMTEEKSRKFSR